MRAWQGGNKSNSNSSKINATQRCEIMHQSCLSPFPDCTPLNAN